MCGFVKMVKAVQPGLIDQAGLNQPSLLSAALFRPAPGSVRGLPNMTPPMRWKASVKGDGD